MYGQRVAFLVNVICKAKRFCRAQKGLSTCLALQCYARLVGSSFPCKGVSFNEGLTLEKSAFEALYGGQFTLSTQLIRPHYLVTLPPTKHHSFFRNLLPLLMRIDPLNK